MQEHQGTCSLQHSQEPHAAAHHDKFSLQAAQQFSTRVSGKPALRLLPSLCWQQSRVGVWTPRKALHEALLQGVQGLQPRRAAVGAESPQLQQAVSCRPCSSQPWLVFWPRGYLLNITLPSAVRRALSSVQTASAPPGTALLAPRLQGRSSQHTEARQ